MIFIKARGKLSVIRGSLVYLKIKNPRISRACVLRGRAVQDKAREKRQGMDSYGTLWALLQSLVFILRAIESH